MPPDNNPLNETFEPIVFNDYDSEVENASTPPLPDEKWKFVVCDYITLKSGEKSKAPGTPYVKFLCEVKDKNPEFDGRKVRTGPLMLSGAGFTFFLDFAGLVSPSRKFKKDTQAIGSDGKSDYLASFKGCTFAARTEKDTNDEGKETGFNSMTDYFSLG